MSKTGKQNIKIPEGVTIVEQDGFLKVSGPKGSKSTPLLRFVELKIFDGVCTSSVNSNSKQAVANWGTFMALLKNTIIGVTEGFEKVLEIEGVGFRASMDGKDLVLNVGYSHPVKFPSPEGITISAEKNSITVKGIDKYLVGQMAANIRAIKKPEPYKGKGIRYRGEVVARKAGKKVAGSTG